MANPASHKTTEKKKNLKRSKIRVVTETQKEKKKRKTVNSFFYTALDPNFRKLCIPN